MFESILEAVEAAERDGLSLGELALRAEAETGIRTREEVEAGLQRALEVMRGAVERGLQGDIVSVSGLVGGDAARLAGSNGPMAGTPFVDALAAALAVQEVNAAMGVIVAAPTAGGAGVLPGTLLGLARHHDFSDDDLVRALATAGLVGSVVAQRASLSGAEGGCQAETGAAAGMAAAAGVELLGGTPRQAMHAVAVTMQGTLGLICDPLGGLVEVPCVYRNATGAAMALAGIEMALAGVGFPIPV
ncbi:MAG TPA: L-serine ammonia-lyase, iron-sulfur-dependent, subunit alpha, partial [Gemmatimonadales bacterium]|nr:L-serine ammonia-lyase, iron-sulfur-dependent, subunit alpha [Gemmatimonadales bacterium]